MALSGQHRLPNDLLRYLIAVLPFHHWESIVGTFSWRTWQFYCQYRYGIEVTQLWSFSTPYLYNTVEFFTKVANIAGDISWKGQVYLPRQIYEAYLVKSNDPISDFLFAQYALYYGDFVSTSLLLLLMESGSTRKLLYYLFYRGRQTFEQDIFRHIFFTNANQLQLLMGYIADNNFSKDDLWYFLNGFASRYVEQTEWTSYTVGVRNAKESQGRYQTEDDSLKDLIYPSDRSDDRKLLKSVIINNMPYLVMRQRAVQLLPVIANLPQNGNRDYLLQNLRFIIDPDTSEPYTEKLAIVCSRFDLIKNSDKLNDCGIFGYCYQRDILLATRHLLANTHFKENGKIYFLHRMWEAAILRNQVMEFLAIPGVLETLRQPDLDVNQSIEVLREVTSTQKLQWNNLAALEKRCSETKWQFVAPNSISIYRTPQDSTPDLTVEPVINTVTAANYWKERIPELVVSSSDKTNYPLLMTYDNWVLSL